MSGESTTPNKAYPSALASNCPHTSGGGAAEFGYTGAAAAAIDCTALAGRHVSIFTEIAADGLNGSAYRFFWHTSDTPPALASASTAGDLNPTNKMYNRFGGDNPIPVEQVVDAERPYLIFQPASSISSAENIIVSVSQLDVIS